MCDIPLLKQMQPGVSIGKWRLWQKENTVVPGLANVILSGRPLESETLGTQGSQPPAGPRALPQRKPAVHFRRGFKPKPFLPGLPCSETEMFANRDVGKPSYHCITEGGKGGAKSGYTHEDEITLYIHFLAPRSKSMIYCKTLALTSWNSLHGGFDNEL